MEVGVILARGWGDEESCVIFYYVFIKIFHSHTSPLVLVPFTFTSSSHFSYQAPACTAPVE